MKIMAASVGFYIIGWIIGFKTGWSWAKAKYDNGIVRYDLTK